VSQVYRYSQGQTDRQTDRRRNRQKISTHQVHKHTQHNTTQRKQATMHSIHTRNTQYITFNTAHTQHVSHTQHYRRTFTTIGVPSGCACICIPMDGSVKTTVMVLCVLVLLCVGDLVLPTAQDLIIVNIVRIRYC
jgi:hypothetical protein